MKRILILALITFSTVVIAQNGKVLVISDEKGQLIIDGESLGDIEVNSPLKKDLIAGEHYIQVKSTKGTKDETVTIEADKQKIVKIVFNANSQVSTAAPVSNSNEVNVAEIDFIIPGGLTVGVWLSDNPGKEYDYPKYYYAFDKGDEVVLNFTMDNKKGTNILEVRSYPDNNLVYSNNSFQALENVSFTANERGIYKFEFNTNHTFERSCNFKIKRKPATAEGKLFNTKVIWETANDTIWETQKDYLYEAKQVIPPTDTWVNSGSNATFRGGKSRVELAVNLPDNTVEWYYIVTASRDENDVNNNSKSLHLVSEVAKGLDKTGLVGLGIEMFTQPPGADYCDVYLLDYDNVKLFLDKTQYSYKLQGTRTNIMSGISKIDCCTTGQWYLGIKNPDTSVGVNVAIEVVAIVKKDAGTLSKKPVKIEKKKVARMVAGG